jgi:transposase, IS30 family
VARFFRHMISENVQVFWAALQRGEFITDAAEVVGTYRKQGARWVIASGGVRPRRGRNLQGRYLCFAEREEIALAAPACTSRGRQASLSDRCWGPGRSCRNGAQPAEVVHRLATSWSLLPGERQAQRTHEGGLHAERTLDGGKKATELRTAQWK